MKISEYWSSLERLAFDEPIYYKLIDRLREFPLTGEERVLEISEFNEGYGDEEESFIMLLQDIFHIEDDVLGMKYEEITDGDDGDRIKILSNQDKIIIELPEYNGTFNYFVSIDTSK